MTEATIFAAALEKATADERTAYLAEACAGDEKLRRRVEALLKAHAESDDLLDPPKVSTMDYRPITERPGTRIGPYRLMEQIGEGGFGLVFVAEQQEPVRRKVALKVIKPGMDSAQVIARFEAERQALALMDHPNIARVLDAGATESGRPYFVMELVRGIPISDYCDQNQLTPRERLELFVTICHAIQHAHQKGIIHRDVNPTNVLVTSHDGKPVAKVMDFGVAKATHQHLTERTIYTQFAQMIGTPLYMSPEQAEMSGLDIDTRSDIYSLGVLLYELLTGSTPLEKKRFATAAYDEIRRLIREQEPPRPSQRLSPSDTLPSVAASRKTEPARLSRMMRGELDWIVMKALEKDRNRRYDTANSLAADIERYLRDETIQARPPSSMYKLRKFAQRNRAAVLTGSLVAAALLTAAVVSTSLAVRATGAERQARQERDRAAAEEEALLERNTAVTEKERADEQAAIAKAVNEFLQQDLLGQASPS
jgi:serine/threonine protein kinase